VSRLAFYISKAATELRDKSMRDIQIETALTWAGRAIVAASQGSDDAVEYAHEAIEHAALSGDFDLLRSLRETLVRAGIVL
jgi:hypothetical protein